ncbi:hypothetical protein MY4824_006708 [Beauveria thailandica]
MHSVRRELCLRAHAAQRSASRGAHTGQARLMQTLTHESMATPLSADTLCRENMRNRFENAHAADEAERSTDAPQHSASVQPNETFAAGKLPLAPKRSHVPYASTRLKRDRALLQRVRAHVSEKEKQRGYLPFLCSESELNSAQRQFDRWKSAILKLNSGRKSALQYTNDQGRWLYEHDDITSMRDAWEAMDIETRRKEWPAVMLATLTNCPSKVAMVLEATLNPLPPGYAIHDVLHVMGQRLQLDSIKDANDRALMADKVLALLAHILEDVPQGHVPFRQHTVGLFAARLPAAQAKDLYDILKKKNFRLHRHTELQFASKLAGEVAYKNTAYEILKALVESGVALNDAAPASVVTKLLQYKTISDGRSQAVDSFAVKDALELFMAHGYTPNTITLTAFLSTLCQAGQTEEAIHVALLFAEHGVQLDGRAWTTVFAGAKASLNVETVTKALLVAKVTPVSFASVLSNALHAVFYFATSETHSKKMEAPWAVPMFRPMLKTYAKRFELKSLQWWLPDSLPLLLSDEGIDKEVDDKFRDPLDRQWDFVHTILPVVDKVFETGGDAAETKLQPNTMADAVMLRTYIRSLSHPQDIAAFYRYFKSRLEEDEKYPKLLLRSQGAMIHDTFILVMTEHPELWREALHVFGDMLKATLRASSAANNDKASNQAPDSTSHFIHSDHGKPADETAMEKAVHPAPTVLTMTILLRGLLYQREDALAEQLLQVMRELDIEPNLVTWNTLIRHKALAQNTDETVTLLQEMEAAGLKPDKYTYDAFRKLRDQDKALRMMQLIVDENRKSMEADNLRGLSSHSPSCPAPARNTASTAFFGSSALLSITKYHWVLAKVRAGQSHPDQRAQPYHVATAWSAVVSSIQDIQHMLQADSDAESNPEFASVKEFDQLLGHSRSIGIEEIKYSLPSKPLTDRVILCYFSAKFHAYEAFWADPASTDLLWISLLFSILGAGALLAKAKLANESPGRAGVGRSDAAACARAQRAAAGRGPHAVGAVRARRAAHGPAAKGYHRDPSRLPVPVSAFCGRDAPPHLAHDPVSPLSCSVALHAGLPPIIHESLIDTEHPVNLLDEDF